MKEVVLKLLEILQDQQKTYDNDKNEREMLGQKHYKIVKALKTNESKLLSTKDKKALQRELKDIKSKITYLSGKIDAARPLLFYTLLEISKIPEKELMK